MNRLNTPFIHSIGEIHLRFEYIYTPLDNKFFVTITGINEEPVSFEMTRDSFDSWKIIQPAPFCVLDWEREIKAALASSLQIWRAA